MEKLNLKSLGGFVTRMGRNDGVKLEVGEDIFIFIERQHANPLKLSLRIIAPENVRIRHLNAEAVAKLIEERGEA